MKSEVDNRLRFIIAAAALLLLAIGLRTFDVDSQPEPNWVQRQINTNDSADRGTEEAPESEVLPPSSRRGVNLVRVNAAATAERLLEDLAEKAPAVTEPSLEAPSLEGISFVEQKPLLGEPVVAKQRSQPRAFPSTEAASLQEELASHRSPRALPRQSTPWPSPTPQQPSSTVATTIEPKRSTELAEPANPPVPNPRDKAIAERTLGDLAAASPLPLGSTEGPFNLEHYLISPIAAEISLENRRAAANISSLPGPPNIQLVDHEISILERLESGKTFDTTAIGQHTEVRSVLDGDSHLRVAALPEPATGKQEKPKFKKFGATKKDVAAKAAKEDQDDEPSDKKSTTLSSSTRWKLAPTPRKGDRYKDDTPLTDQHSAVIQGAHGNFSPTPTMPGIGYDPLAQMNVYQGKQLYANQRPLLELGRPWYQLGPISEGASILGFHNHVNPQYVLFGDARSAIASNNSAGNGDTLIASQINLFHHFKFTSTERFVAGHSPLGSGNKNTRYSFDEKELFFEGTANFSFAYLEGDIGALVGGATGETLPFDLPFAAGIVPLVFQNGIWMEDEILGFALTIPARNSARLDISNMDITFFAGYDRLDSPAFAGDDSAARVLGVASFLDALNGHFEIDYAFLDDRSVADRSYHNIGIGYTRRYGRFLSNSTRVIVNAGQQNNSPGTADGVLLLSENSLITGHPSTVVPYFNMFAGFDRPQSVGRNGNAGSILRNTGILFESDNLTGYPTLDATANDTFGMALGLNLLADEFAQQLVVEAAMLGVMGDSQNRNANGDQFGLGVRYQLPLTNSVLIRADAMVGFLRNDDDVRGARLEIRKKF